MGKKCNMIKSLKTGILFSILILPLGIPSFFHTGSNFEFRITILSFELMFCFFISFFYMEKNSRYYFPFHEFILFALWAMCASIAVILSDHYVPGAIRQLEWFVQIFFSFCLWAFLRNKQRVIIYTHLLVITGFLLVCAGLIFYWNILPDPHQYDWMTMTPNFINIRHFSHYCTALLIFSTAFLLNGSEKHISKVGSFLLLSLCWSFLFWSGGRAGIGSAAVGLFFVYLIFDKKKYSIPIIIILSCMVGYLLSDAFAVENRALGFVNAIKRSDFNGFLSHRIELWLVSLKWIKSSFFFGMGPDAFRFLPNTDFIYDHPHNTMIQFSLDWGVPGTLLFIGLQLRLMKMGFKILLKENTGWLKGIKLSCFSWIVASLVFGLVDGIYYFAIPMTLTAYSFAVIFLENDKKPRLNFSKTYAIPINRNGIRSIVSILVIILALHKFFS